MSLTDRPLRDDETDQRRLIVAVITTTDHRHPRPSIERTALVCHSDDLDPEFRQPWLWFQLMLDEEEGDAPGVKRFWRDLAEHSRPDEHRVTVWMSEGGYILDESGCCALEVAEHAIAQAERAVVNP